MAKDTDTTPTYAKPIRSRSGSYKVNQMPALSRLYQIFDLNPVSGELRWMRRDPSEFGATAKRTSSELCAAWNDKFAVKSAGYACRGGYKTVKIDGLYYQAHRIVYVMFYQEHLGDSQVDHIDGDRANNSPRNLRRATFAENAQNRGVRNSFGLKGVKPKRGKFQARIKISGKETHLGTFETAELAHAAYQKAAVAAYGEFARFE
jgi:hypothetical protein